MTTMCTFEFVDDEAGAFLYTGVSDTKFDFSQPVFMRVMDFTRNSVATKILQLGPRDGVMELGRRQWKATMHVTDVGPVVDRVFKVTADIELGESLDTSHLWPDHQ